MVLTTFLGLTACGRKTAVDGEVSGWGEDNAALAREFVYHEEKIFIMLLVLTVSAGVMVGCSQRPVQDADATGTSIQQSEVIKKESKEAEDAKLETAEAEVSEVKGIVDETKDFMFIVTDDNKVSYAFSFEEKPEGLDEVAVGDKVIVKYTGTVSQVDPFKGEVLSVEKQP